jgi:hypothetical protein
MQSDRIDDHEPIELGEEALALVAGGSYRARGSSGGFDEEP